MARSLRRRAISLRPAAGMVRRLPAEAVRISDAGSLEASQSSVTVVSAERLQPLCEIGRQRPPGNRLPEGESLIGAASLRLPQAVVSSLRALPNPPAGVLQGIGAVGQPVAGHLPEEDAAKMLLHCPSGLEAD